jgi:SNF2 family DNA or RNA helicase
MKLLEHQVAALDRTADRNRVAYYLAMGLGKTYVGAEKLVRLGADRNLVVCQKSKVDDWVIHFREHYDYPVIRYQKRQSLPSRFVAVINYDLLWRRPELLDLTDHTLMLDESSLIQNRTSKRSRFVLQSNPTNVILLSGTPIGGKYESLWTQCNLLGWPISEELFVRHFCDYHYDKTTPFPTKIIDGYKNVERLKRKLSNHGAVFMKTEDVIDLPEQIFQQVLVNATTKYHKFKKTRLCSDPDLEGGNALTHLLGLRRLCGAWNDDKLTALKDLIDSTDERIVVFYNFNEERDAILNLIDDRPVSIICGETKDLTAYEQYDNAIILVQYQAGAMGINLQKAWRMIFFSLPLSSELFEQAQKRIHRIGQTQTCFYYLPLVNDSIEIEILNTLQQRQNYTDYLFRRTYE